MEMEQTPNKLQKKYAQTPGDSEGEGSLECCNLWVRKELDTT